uniref:Uncharacterized protein n=1 Tax=Gibberella zeae TaxID=5518 RepID=A0A4E9EH14_GIBZA
MGRDEIPHDYFWHIRLRLASVKPSLRRHQVSSRAGHLAKLLMAAQGNPDSRGSLPTPTPTPPPPPPPPPCLLDMGGRR